jgi:hypothetical protein
LGVMTNVLLVPKGLSMLMLLHRTSACRAGSSRKVHKSKTITLAKLPEG